MSTVLQILSADAYYDQYRTILDIDFGCFELRGPPARDKGTRAMINNLRGRGHLSQDWSYL